MEERNLYEYAVIRYVPRVEREEFINIGLLMMCKRRRWIRVRINIDPERMCVLRPLHTVDEIERQLSTFRNVCEGSREGGPMAQLPVEERFRWLTAVKSACLQTSRPHPAHTSDLDAAFDRLFTEQVL